MCECFSRWINRLLVFYGIWPCLSLSDALPLQLHQDGGPMKFTFPFDIFLERYTSHPCLCRCAPFVYIPFRYIPCRIFPITTTDSLQFRLLFQWDYSRRGVIQSSRIAFDTKYARFHLWPYGLTQSTIDYLGKKQHNCQKWNGIKSPYAFNGKYRHNLVALSCLAEQIKLNIRPHPVVFDRVIVVSWSMYYVDNVFVHVCEWV